MQRSLVFYQYLGAHSLLIGLVPFYLPVWLWQAGADIATIAFFVALTGAGFVVCLRLWEISANRLRPATLFLTSFMLELLLVAVACLSILPNTPPVTSIGFIVPLALASGAYNCFFWTTQRSLFLSRINVGNSGRQYGNLQIFVAVFLKLGIVIGGLLLERDGIVALLGVSVVVGLSSSLWFYFKARENTPLYPHPPIGKSKLRSFRDSAGSRTVFVIDGLFLFLESHFWTISLFLLAQQNFTRLGLIVVVLAVAFSIIFYLSKNVIDQIGGQHVFQVAVVVYAIGWLLRAPLSEEAPFAMTAALLVVITFCTSFFRLLFNKRFFDIAEATSGQQYLIIKSYYTQFAVVWLFLLVALLAAHAGELNASPFVLLYVAAAVCALLYLRYGHKSSKRDTAPVKTSD